MINFQIYKNGHLIAFENENNCFKKETFQTLFIFHGLYGRGKNWQTFSKKLSNEKKQIVVTVDLRNHGGNEFEEDISYILMMNDILSLFNYLGVKNTNLLGHSMGGKLAMVIALLEPKYVNKVIIADISPIDYDNDENLIINSLLNLNLDLIKNRGEADNILSEDIGQKFLRSFLLQNLELVDGKYKWSLNLKVIKKSLNDLRKFPTIKNINPIIRLSAVNPINPDVVVTSSGLLWYLTIIRTPIKQPMIANMISTVQAALFRKIPCSTV